MPVIPSDFKPPRGLRNPHVQTIAGALLRRRHRSATAQERLELADGDFIDLQWNAPRARRRLAILSHGLEGNAEQGYIRGMAEALAAAGWNSLAWNFRGCGVEPNRLARFYHSGATDDLRAVIARAAADYPKVALIGFSLGGNLTLKYLGETTPHACIVAAAAISAPVDLAASARMLDSQRGNRLYLRRFLRSLVAKVEAKSARFPAEIDARGCRSLRTFAEFDDRYTAPLHGFRDAEDYWAKSSARQFLPQIAVPTLLLNAIDDPFLAPECFPFAEAETHAQFFFEAPAHGGHLGFLDRLFAARPYHERRVVQFLAASAPGL